MSDRLLGGIVLIVALAFVVGATQIKTSGLIFEPVGPRTFPIIIGCILAVSAIFPIIRPDPDPNWPPKRRLLEIGIVLVVLIVYAQILTTIGYVAATSLAAGVISWRLGARPWVAGIVGLGVGVGTYLVFHLVLKLSLAEGPWGF